MKNEMILEQFIRSYWNYYLELEEQIILTKRYVEFDESNFKTFSIEYLKLFQAVCSEIDVVGKYIAEMFNKDFRKIENKNIQKWGYEIHKMFPEIEEKNVCFNNKIQMKPWENWEYIKYRDNKNALKYKLADKKKTPFWWSAYNKVKHERTSIYQGDKTNYVRANLKNLVYAMAALYIVESLFIEYLKKNISIDINIKKSNLFILE